MRERIKAEFELLLQSYDDVLHAEAGGEDWFRVPRYILPDGWTIAEKKIAEIPVAFVITTGYPDAEPYGFFAPDGLKFNGTAPGSTGSPPKPVPFDGSWMHFSWSPEGTWAPRADVRKGSNLLVWARSFAQRFESGA